MVFEIRVDFGMITGIFAVLVVLGIAFNTLTAWLERNSYIEGYTSLVVAAGVLLTVAPLAILSWQFTLIVYGAFISSGVPMILGSIARYIAQRAAAIQSMREGVHGNEPPGVAK